MIHRHPGQYVSKKPKGGYTTKKNPLHTQTLIFRKPKYTRLSALAWAKNHGFKHNTAREEGNSIRLRQFDPKYVTRYGGTYDMGNNVKGVYAEVDQKRFKNEPYSKLKLNFNISKNADDDGDGVPNSKDCRPWDKKRQDLFFFRESQEEDDALAEAEFKKRLDELKREEDEAVRQYEEEKMEHMRLEAERE